MRPADPESNRAVRQLLRREVSIDDRGHNRHGSDRDRRRAGRHESGAIPSFLTLASAGVANADLVGSGPSFLTLAAGGTASVRKFALVAARVTTLAMLGRIGLIRPTTSKLSPPGNP
jgi:hypothetical protein